MGGDVGLWPIAEMPAAARHGRLPRVNLPARIAFVNPDSLHHGPRREAGGASIIPPDANSFRRDQGAATAASSLPARSPMVGVLQAPSPARRRREAFDTGGVPLARRAAAAPGPTPVARSAATPSMPARW